MITVIIAGGSGTRLWPLSTPDYPKHLLSLTGRRSLLQYTFERAKTISDKIFIVTDHSHDQHIKDQLKDLPEEAFIIEPARRGTAHCLLLALKQISKINPDESIAIMAADHYVRDTKSFTKTFKLADKISQSTDRIVLIGVKPDYPATGFGYIQKDGIFNKNYQAYNVHSFKEKPNYELAENYLKSDNYFWNCGYFVGSVNTFISIMEEHAPRLLIDYHQLLATKTKSQENKIYLKFESDSIDYALIEKDPNLLVVTASFDWMDLGSYSDLHKASARNAVHNHIEGENIELEGVENSFVFNQEDKPVAVIGLNNIVVVNTKDGLLVARKDLAQQVGEVSKRFNKAKS